MDVERAISILEASTPKDPKPFKPILTALALVAVVAWLYFHTRS